MLGSFDSPRRVNQNNVERTHLISKEVPVEEPYITVDERLGVERVLTFGFRLYLLTFVQIGDMGIFYVLDELIQERKLCWFLLVRVPVNYFLPSLGFRFQFGDSVI